MNYGQPVIQGPALSTILTVIMIVLIIYMFPVRDYLNGSRNKKLRARNQIAVQEQRDYIRKQNTMAQAKRDEQIRLLTELVELGKQNSEMQKQSLQTQKKILELLKHQ